MAVRDSPCRSFIPVVGMFPLWVIFPLLACSCCWCVPVVGISLPRGIKGSFMAAMGPSGDVNFQVQATVT
jgi:hypothetical protein